MLSGFEVARSCHVTYLKSGCQRVLMNWAQGTISLLASLIYNLLVCGQLDLRLPKLQLHGMVIAIGTSEVAVSYLVSLLLPFGELTLTSLSLPPLSSSSSDSCTCSSLEIMESIGAVETRVGDPCTRLLVVCPNRTDCFAHVYYLLILGYT